MNKKPELQYKQKRKQYTFHDDMITGSNNSNLRNIRGKNHIYNNMYSIGIEYFTDLISSIINLPVKAYN